jgi:hypothetical protein
LNDTDGSRTAILFGSASVVDVPEAGLGGEVAQRAVDHADPQPAAARRGIHAGQLIAERRVDPLRRAVVDDGHLRDIEDRMGDRGVRGAGNASSAQSVSAKRMVFPL